MQAQFRELWRHAASPVTVVTSAFNRELAGMTISSLTSVSMGPPHLLVSFNCQTPSRTGDFIHRSQHVVLNQLAMSPSNVLLAKAFAGFGGQRHTNPFEKYPDLFTPGSESEGIPRITAAAAQLLCRVRHVVPAQDHEIIIASVHKMWINGGTPLIYRDHQFGACT